MRFNSVKLNSSAAPSYPVAHNMLHVISTLCAARDLHMIAPRHRSVRARDSLQRSEETVKNLELCLSVQLLLLLYPDIVNPKHDMSLTISASNLNLAIS